ncbi:MAG: AAA family ATPase [Lachnospiraceae bacterium]|nr:AAA family ATPase [Lachnospiraceae bacterium]
MICRCFEHGLSNTLKNKTGFIKELMDRTFDINLITRPRRFGKTLIMDITRI